MATLVTPGNQQRLLDPYQNRIFDFDTVDSKVYLSRTNNFLLQAIGNDLILDGFEPTVTFNGNIINILLSKGTAIIDSTLIKIEEDVTLDIDVSSYDDSGQLVVFLSYMYLETIEDNPIKVKLLYVSSDGNTILGETLIPNRDRIIPAIIKFSKSSGVISSVTVKIMATNDITILGKKINVRGYKNSKLSGLMTHFIGQNLTLEDTALNVNYNITVSNGNLVLEEI